MSTFSFVIPKPPAVEASIKNTGFKFAVPSVPEPGDRSVRRPARDIWSQRNRESRSTRDRYGTRSIPEPPFDQERSTNLNSSNNRPSRLFEKSGVDQFTGDKCYEVSKIQQFQVLNNYKLSEINSRTGGNVFDSNQKTLGQTDRFNEYRVTRNRLCESTVTGSDRLAFNQEGCFKTNSEPQKNENSVNRFNVHNQNPQTINNAGSIIESCGEFQNKNGFLSNNCFPTNIQQNESSMNRFNIRNRNSQNMSNAGSMIESCGRYQNNLSALNNKFFPPDIQQDERSINRFNMQNHNSQNMSNAGRTNESCGRSQQQRSSVFNRYCPPNEFNANRFNDFNQDSQLLSKRTNRADGGRYQDNRNYSSNNQFNENIENPVDMHHRDSRMLSTSVISRIDPCEAPQDRNPIIFGENSDSVQRNESQWFRDQQASTRSFSHAGSMIESCGRSQQQRSSVFNRYCPPNEFNANRFNDYNQDSQFLSKKTNRDDGERYTMHHRDSRMLSTSVISRIDPCEATQDIRNPIIFGKTSDSVQHNESQWLRDQQASTSSTTFTAQNKPVNWAPQWKKYNSILSQKTSLLGQHQKRSVYNGGADNDNPNTTCSGLSVQDVSRFNTTNNSSHFLQTISRKLFQYFGPTRNKFTMNDFKAGEEDILQAITMEMSQAPSTCSSFQVGSDRRIKPKTGSDILSLYKSSKRSRLEEYKSTSKFVVEHCEIESSRQEIMEDEAEESMMSVISSFPHKLKSKNKLSNVFEGNEDSICDPPNTLKKKNRRSLHALRKMATVKKLISQKKAKEIMLKKWTPFSCGEVLKLRGFVNNELVETEAVKKRVNNREVVLQNNTVCKVIGSPAPSGLPPEILSRLRDGIPSKWKVLQKTITEKSVKLTVTKSTTKIVRIDKQAKVERYNKSVQVQKQKTPVVNTPRERSTSANRSRNCASKLRLYDTPVRAVTPNKRYSYPSVHSLTKQAATKSNTKSTAKQTSKKSSTKSTAKNNKKTATATDKKKQSSTKSNIKSVAVKSKLKAPAASCLKKQTAIKNHSKKIVPITPVTNINRTLNSKSRQKCLKKVHAMDSTKVTSKEELSEKASEKELPEESLKVDKELKLPAKEEKAKRADKGKTKLHAKSDKEPSPVPVQTTRSGRVVKRKRQNLNESVLEAHADADKPKPGKSSVKKPPSKAATRDKKPNKKVESQESMESESSAENKTEAAKAPKSKPKPRSRASPKVTIRGAKRKSKYELPPDIDESILDDPQLLKHVENYRLPKVELLRLEEENRSKMRSAVPLDSKTPPLNGFTYPKINTKTPNDEKNSPQWLISKFLESDAQKFEKKMKNIRKKNVAARRKGANTKQPAPKRSNALPHSIKNHFDFIIGKRQKLKDTPKAEDDDDDKIDTDEEEYENEESHKNCMDEDEEAYEDE